MAVSSESEGTDAFYSPETKEIVVYGTDIDIYTQVVLVHELTHVLQDQHFDLSRSFNSDGADSLYKALGEGDATRIEDKYIESLDDDDQEAYYDAIDDSQDSADRSVDDVAPTLLQLFGAPYALGGPMTTIVESEQGVLALDTLFRNPVPSDEGLINVFALLDGERPKDVATPKVGNGEKLTDEGSGFGAITWYLVLASFIDPHVALHAVDGWGGDAYIGCSKNGDECIRADFVGDTPNDTNEMHAALDQWKQAFPPDKVTVTGNDAGVELSACEPDTVPTPRADAGEALSLPVARMQMLQGALDQGMPRDIAECFGARVMDRISLEKLASDKQSDLQDAFNVGMQVGRECAQEAGRA